MTTKIKYWYEWGNEKRGYVSTGYYTKNGLWVECKKIKKEDALRIGLTFINPFLTVPRKAAARNG